MCGESSGSKGGCPHGATVAGKVSHILVTPGREGDHPQTRKKRYQDIEVEASMRSFTKPWRTLSGGSTTDTLGLIGTHAPSLH